MAKLLIFSHQAIEEEGLVSGPSQRILELAKALKRRGHDVHIAEPDRKEIEDKEIKLIPWDITLEKNITYYDAALVQIQCNNPEFIERISKIPLITDISTPILVEFMEFLRKADTKAIKHNEDWFFEEQLLPLTNLIQKSDLFLCASKAQMLYYLGMLNVLGKITPLNYGKKIIEVVASAVPHEEPKHTENLLQLTGKKVLLYPGGLYPWMEPKIALDAVDILSKERDDIALVFLGYNNPRAPHSLSYKHAKELMVEAKKRNLLNKQVFFKGWIEYNRRHNAYLESQLAVITYAYSVEAELSYRTRALDCFWARLPVISSKGGEIAELIKEKQLGVVLQHNTAEELASTIRELLSTEKTKQMKQHINIFIEEEFNWDTAVVPIDRFLDSPHKDPTKGKSMAELIASKNTVITLLREQLGEIKPVLENKYKEISQLQRRYEDELREKQSRIEQLQKQIEVQNLHISTEIDRREHHIHMLEAEVQKQSSKIETEVEKHQKWLAQAEDDKRMQQRERTEEKLLRDQEIERFRQQYNEESRKKDHIVEQLNTEITRLHTEFREKENLHAQELARHDKIIEQKNHELIIQNEIQHRTIQKLENGFTREKEVKDEEIKEVKKHLSNIEEELRLKNSQLATKETEKLDEIRKHQLIIEKLHLDIGGLEKERKESDNRYQKLQEIREEDMKELNKRIGAEVEKHQVIIKDLEDELDTKDEMYQKFREEKEKELQVAWQKVETEVEKHQGIIERITQEKLAVQQKFEDDLRIKGRMLEQRDEEIQRVWAKVAEEVSKHQNIIRELENEQKQTLRDHTLQLQEKENEKRSMLEHAEYQHRSIVDGLKKELASNKEELAKTWGKVDAEVRKHQAIIQEITFEKNAMQQKLEQELLAKQKELDTAWQNVGREVEKHQKIILQLEEDIQAGVRNNARELKELQKEHNELLEKLKEKSEKDLSKAWEKVGEEVHKHQAIISKLEIELEQLKERKEREQFAEQQKHERLLLKVEEDLKKAWNDDVERLRDKETELKKQVELKEKELEKVWEKVSDEVKKHQHIIVELEETNRIERRNKEKFEEERDELLKKLKVEQEALTLGQTQLTQKITALKEQLKNERDDAQQHMINIEEELGKATMEHQVLLQEKEQEIAQLWLHVGQEVEKHQGIIKEREQELQNLKWIYAAEHEQRKKLLQYYEQMSSEFSKREEHIKELREMLAEMEQEAKGVFHKKDVEIRHFKNRLKEILKSKPYKFFNNIHHIRKKLGLLPRKKELERAYS